MLATLILTGCGFTAGSPDVPSGVELPPPVPVAPCPRPVAPPVTITAAPGGYRVSLNRQTATLLRDALDQADEKDVAATLRGLARDKQAATPPDEQTAATLELTAFVVASQLPGFKAALREKMGPGGVAITFTGLQAPAVKFRKPRPRLERAVEAVRGVMPLLPDDARGAVEAMRAVGRTTPLFWTVEPLP